MGIKAKVRAPNGQMILKRNFDKSYADLGGYRKPPLVVSKKAVATGGKKAYVDAAKGQSFSKKKQAKMIKDAQNYDGSTAGGSWPKVPEVMGPKQAQTRGLLGAMKDGWHGISAWGWHKKNARLGQPQVSPKPLKY
jgi:hypothetical protein